MLPPESVVTSVFSSQHPIGRSAERSHPSMATGSARREPFPAWSVIDETKKKADALAHEASREFDVVSKKAQAKTGHIEPWTPKYYASCTVGGLLACVSSISSTRQSVVRQRWHR